MKLKRFIYLSSFEHPKQMLKLMDTILRLNDLLIWTYIIIIEIANILTYYTSREFPIQNFYRRTNDILLYQPLLQQRRILPRVCHSSG